MSKLVRRAPALAVALARSLQAKGYEPDATGVLVRIAYECPASQPERPWHVLLQIPGNSRSVFRGTLGEARRAVVEMITGLPAAGGAA